MPAFISLLRGVNVSGKRPLPMAELRALGERLGYENVRTYLQSGNVVFSAKNAAAAAAFGPAIREKFHADVDVLTLAAKKFAAIVAANPLVGKAGVAEEFLHVTFLMESAKIATGDLALPATGDEVVAFAGGHVFVFCPHGYGRTKLTNTLFERRLEVAATTRNWRTVQALVAMA